MHIDQYDLASGTLVKRYETGPVEELPVRATHDFALDSEQRVNALVLANDEVLVRRFEADGTFTHVPLDHPVWARKLSIDQEGNLYVLGLELELMHELVKWMRTGTSPVPEGPTIRLIWKFSREGKLLASYFPFILPDRESAEEFAKGYPSLSEFAVLPSGEIYFLFRDASQRMGYRLSDYPEQLYAIDTAGDTRAISLIGPTLDAFIYNIHPFGANDLAVQWWTALGRPKVTALTSLQTGDLLYTLQRNGIEAVSETDLVVSVVTGRVGPFTPLYDLIRVQLQ